MSYFVRLKSLNLVSKVFCFILYILYKVVMRFVGLDWREIRAGSRHFKQPTVEIT